MKNIDAKITYASGPKPIPIDMFDVVILSSEAKYLPNWNHKKYKISRVQELVMQWK